MATKDISPYKGLRAQRLRDALGIVFFVLAVVTGGGALVAWANGNHVDAVAVRLASNDVLNQVSAAKKEIMRDRQMIKFFCNDLAWDDQWRLSLLALDTKFHPPASAYFNARKALFEERAKHATAREAACAALPGQI